MIPPAPQSVPSSEGSSLEHAHVWPISAATTGDGTATQFTLAGHRIEDLVAQWQSPAYFLDVADLKARASAFVTAMQEHGARHGIVTSVYYASKAFSSIQVVRWVHELGLRVDVATEGELAVALRAGVPGNDIGLHGNNKSDAELALALEHSVGRIVVDSIQEIDRLGQLAAENPGTTLPVMVRVTTGVHAGGHDFIATAHEDQKFGLSLTSGAAAEAVQKVLATPGLQLTGLHSHIGSQILDLEGFGQALARLLQLRGQIQDEHSYLIPELDIGGGYGIAYLPADEAPSPDSIAEFLLSEVAKRCQELGQAPPEISIEPGRSIIGPAMITAYRVGTTKAVQVEEGFTRRYLSVDGGMSDNIRPALYGAKYHVALANRNSAAAPEHSRVVGKHCESGDIVIDDALLPGDIGPGDLLVVAATGAYCRSLASTYNMMPRPPVIAVTPEASWPIVRRETIEDLLALDLG